MENSRIVQSARLAPVWAMVVLLIIWGLIFVRVILPDGLSPGLPMFVVLGYMMLCGLVNKKHVLVEPGRIEVRFGPLPGGGKPRVATAAEVTHWYVRSVSVRGRYGRTTFHTAGVELTDGRQIEVLAPFNRGHEAWDAANDASRVFSWPGALPVVAASGIPGKLNWQAGRPVIAWGGAVIGALLLGVWIELARH